MFGEQAKDQWGKILSGMLNQVWAEYDPACERRSNYQSWESNLVGK